MHRPLFLAAAAYNIGGGAFCLLFPVFAQRLMLGEPLSGLGAVLWTDLWLFVVIMGVGNTLVAVDPDRNRGIAVVGAIGKAVFGVHWIAVVAGGQATPVLAAGAAGDLALSTLFLWWLWTTRHPRT